MKRGMWVKICGITNAQDALMVEQAGADALGLIFVARSKRVVDIEQARLISDAVGPFITRVGVFMDAPLEEVFKTIRQVRLDVVQLHGDEDAAYAAEVRAHVRVLKAVRVTPALDTAALKTYPADGFLLDGPVPGSGQTFAWNEISVQDLPHPILAGGLTPENVEAAIDTLTPYGVDVASGVEHTAGHKDPQRVQDFVRAAKGLTAS
jgi:phosphoribosylanthranilate isomerase